MWDVFRLLTEQVCFGNDLNEEIGVEYLTVWGRLFQTVVAWNEKDLCLFVFVLNEGILNNLVSEAERSCREGTFYGQQFRQVFWACAIDNRETQGGKLIIYSLSNGKPVRWAKKRGNMAMLWRFEDSMRSIILITVGLMLLSFVCSIRNAWRQRDCGWRKRQSCGRRWTSRKPRRRRRDTTRYSFWFSAAENFNPLSMMWSLHIVHVCASQDLVCAIVMCEVLHRLGWYTLHLEHCCDQCPMPFISCIPSSRVPVHGCKNQGHGNKRRPAVSCVCPEKGRWLAVHVSANVCTADSRSFRCIHRREDYDLFF